MGYIPRPPLRRLQQPLSFCSEPGRRAPTYLDGTLSSRLPAVTGLTLPAAGLGSSQRRRPPSPRCPNPVSFERPPGPLGWRTQWPGATDPCPRKDSSCMPLPRRDMATIFSRVSVARSHAVPSAYSVSAAQPAPGTGSPPLLAVDAYPSLHPSVVVALCDIEPNKPRCGARWHQS